jgi:6-pyruvoyl-tetrahydropterin synthase
MTWKIVIEGGNLSFSAAHFITLDGTYEPLHGHNYGISAELAGDDLTSDSYLLDFGVVKAMLRGYINEVNHRFLLPLHNPFMHLEHNTDADEWEIRLRDGARFVLPAASVVPLPFDNATAERIAEWLADRMQMDLAARRVNNVHRITIGVSETEMQTAFCTVELVS